MRALALPMRRGLAVAVLWFATLAGCSRPAPPPVPTPPAKIPDAPTEPMRPNSPASTSTPPPAPAALAPAAPTTESQRSYCCLYVAADAITLDGKLDEPAWQRAAPLTDFHTSGKQPVPASRVTTARLLWTDTHLLAAYDCRADFIQCAGQERDDTVWAGEAAELFLAPAGGDRPYFEFNVNPECQLYDTHIFDWHYEVMVKEWRNWAKAYNADVRCGVQVERSPAGEPRGWTVELAVPFRDLGPDGAGSGTAPAPGSVWLFNVARAVSRPAKKVEYSCWEPTFGDFHRPFKYPRLEFVRER